MHNVNANGAAIPALGLGTWTLKGDHCAEMVSHALSVGYRHVDTAAAYDNETAVGSGLRASGLARSDIFVTTKVWWTDLAPADLMRSAESSLKRLGLDQVDLLLIHWPNPKIPLEGSIKALNAAKSTGLARHIGVSISPPRCFRKRSRCRMRRWSLTRSSITPISTRPRCGAPAAMLGWRWCPIARCREAACCLRKER